MSSDWTPEEVAATVAAYLRMLTMELTGQAYNIIQPLSRKG